MNLKPYIESGILELYVLGALAADERIGVDRMIAVYPQLKAELQSIEMAMESYATLNAIEPGLASEHVFLNNITNWQKEQEMDKHNLPLINKYANHANWLKLANEFEQATLENGLFIKLLRHDEHVMQSLIVAEVDIPEEIHDNEYESFLILKGNVKCVINGNCNIMGPGDFMAIPLNKPHDVSLLSSQVTAILQRVKV